jgi:para-nitrobenzyl esterase
MRYSAVLILAVLATVAGTTRHRPANHGAPCLVDSPHGPVQGLDFGASCAFLGIPYAASTAGNNRWKPPEPAAPWGPAVLNATTPPPGCPSINQATGALIGSEDCLRLNIWSGQPQNGELAPVIVWLHTGAFSFASANFAGTNGRRLAEETGVIVVAPNYRLGPFGFLAHAALEAEDPGRSSTGNYGLLDQRAALAWVGDHIEDFGGDPHNVTLAGTSAGGLSTGLHLVAPGSAGLFQQAIVQSAHPTSYWATRDEAVLQGDAFATSLGCTSPADVLACMRAATRDQVLTALGLAAQQVVAPANRVFWEPIVDGFEIPDQPRVLFEQGDFEAVPTIIGANRDEGWGNFITRSFPAGVTTAQYEAWVAAEFGPHAPSVLSMYPAADFTSAEEAMARVVGDGQFSCEARRLADLIADGGLRGRGPHDNHGTGRRTKSAVFLYSYEHEIDDLSLDHVIHGVETNIIFGNNYAPPFASHVLDAGDIALHVVMALAWTRFAETGDPNPFAEWPEYRKNHERHIVFDANIGNDEDLGGGVCAFWNGFFFRTMLGSPEAWQ